METIFHEIPFLDIKKSNNEFITFEMWFIIYIRYILGKNDIEWLRSLSTSFSSVFHQDSRGILEIS